MNITEFLFFNSPDPSRHVSYFHHFTSVNCSYFYLLKTHWRDWNQTWLKYFLQGPGEVLLPSCKLSVKHGCQGHNSFCLGYGVIVFKAIFNNISVISWRFWLGKILKTFWRITYTIENKKGWDDTCYILHKCPSVIQYGHHQRTSFNIGQQSQETRTAPVV